MISTCVVCGEKWGWERFRGDKEQKVIIQQNSSLGFCMANRSKRNKMEGDWSVFPLLTVILVGLLWTQQYPVKWGSLRELPTNNEEMRSTITHNMCHHQHHRGRMIHPVVIYKWVDIVAFGDDGDDMGRLVVVKGGKWFFFPSFFFDENLSTHSDPVQETTKFLQICVERHRVFFKIHHSFCRQTLTQHVFRLK